MNAVDTNVLLYAHDPRDPDKKRKAAALLERLEDGVLLWQVACEYMAASRKLVPSGYDVGQAGEDIERLQVVWTVALPTWGVLQKARNLIATHSLSFWDALIVAASIEAGASRLYSEDLAGRRIPGLEIVNPFAE